MICESLAEYEARAVFLAKTPEILAEIRERLVKNRDTTPLFNVDTYCRNFETVLETIVADACKSPSA